MKVEVQALDSYHRKLSFLVPPAQVATRLDAAYKRYGTKARLAGFRPGRVPRKILEARFAPQVESEVAEALINDSFRSAVRDHSLEPVTQPQLEEAGRVTGADGFSFTLTVEVRPSVELSVWTGVDVVYPKVEVGAEEIDAAVRARAARKLQPVTGRPAQKGDFALVELVVTADGAELAREPGTMIATAGDRYYPGIEDAIVGMELEGSKTAEVTFGGAAANAAVAGRTATVEIKLVSLQATGEIDDALAAELGYEGGVGGMRAALEAQIRSARDEQARNQARANLLEVLIARNPFDVPQAMVERSLQMLLDELRRQEAERTGRDPRTIGFSEAQIRDLRARSSFAAKAALILEWVAKREAIAVEEADLDRKFGQLADKGGQTVEAVRGWFRQAEAMQELRERILEEKTLDWLLERSTLVSPDAAAAPAAGA